MPIHSGDRILWILVGLGLLIATKAIPANLNYVRQLTEVKIEDETSQRKNCDVERAVKTKTLEKLAAGRSYEIRSCAIQLIAERCITGPSLILLLDDLASRDSDRRDKAIQALRLFVSPRAIQDSQKTALLTTGQAFHAMITALVNLLPQHDNVLTNNARDDEGKVECYQMDDGLPVMIGSRFKAYKKQAEQMAKDHEEILKESAMLCRIPAQQLQLLALTGLTPLTEYFFNNHAHQWFRENETSIVTVDSVPDIPEMFRRSIAKIICSAEETEGLTGWRQDVSAAERVQHVESLLKALWSCKSIAVQASSLETAISTERDALENSPSQKVYDAYCYERADYFRQLTGGLFQQALESSNELHTMVGGADRDQSENENSKRSILPPSPVLPSRRPVQERTLLLILAKLLDPNNVGMAISTGLISRWLYRYPFPCMLASSKQHDVVAFLQKTAWASDDPVMAQVMDVVASVPAGRKELREYGLTTNFHADGNGGDGYGEGHSAPSRDVVMTGGEDTAGILPSTSQTGRDDRPGSSWPRRHPTLDSRSDEIQRRRRREAMVISDGEGPLTESNILQRENSHAPLVPGEEPGIEEQLAQLSEEIDREDEYEMAALRERSVSRRAAQWRDILAGITGSGH